MQHCSMELHSHGVAAAATRRIKLPEFLRVAFFTMRKGLSASKKGKPLGRSLRKLMLHRSSRSGAAGRFGLREYEFSCSSSPTYRSSSYYERWTNGHGFFSCMSSRAVEEPAGGVFGHQAPVEYSPAAYCAHRPATGEQCRSFQASSPLPDVISTYCESEDEEDGSRSEEIDERAEEFIRRFYEQLRAQGNHALLQ